MAEATDVITQAITRWRWHMWAPLFCAVLAVPLFGATPARAQLFPLPSYSVPNFYQSAGRRKRRRPVRRYRKKKAPLPRAAWHPGESEKDPVQIIVSLPDQKATVYQGDKVLVTSRVSSGKPGYTTPSGVFSILQKNRIHHSNIYSRAPMPFMQRLTWSGIALHASNSVPNRPASHGCVRLPPAFARELFPFTNMGAHVIIANQTSDMATPYEISHENLLQPAPRSNGEFDIGEDGLVPARAPLDTRHPHFSYRKAPWLAPVRVLVTRRTGREQLKDVQGLLNQLQFGAGDVDGWMGPDTAKSIRRFQKTYGLVNNGLVSDELIEALYRVAGRGEPLEGHIYVRQGFDPVFDAPIGIREHQKPLGSYLFTAMHFEEGATLTRWLAVNLKKAPPTPAKGKRKIARKAKPKPVILGVTTVEPGSQPEPEIAGSAAEALSRIDIPADIRERLNRMLTPGSSLAISDDGISKETTPKGSDFIVLTRTKLPKTR